MKSLFVFLITIGLWLTGCTQTDETERSTPVGFTTTISTQTRGTDYSSENLPPTMGVLAYFSQGGDFGTTSSTPDYMYNQKVTNSGGTWSYSPVVYWPADKNDKLSFFAYAPYMDEAGSNLTFPEKTSHGYPVLTYTVPGTEADQTDLLASVPLMNQTYSANNGKVSFALKHSLTKVIVYVKSGDKYAKEITALSIHTANKGELHFNDSGFEWKNITGGADYTPTVFPTFAATDAGKDVATFYLLPTGTANATYSLTYKVKKADGTEILTKTINAATLPSTSSWQPGATVSYTFTLYEKTAMVSTKSISEWTAGAAETHYTTFSASDLKVGDYYYSDGSTSDGGLRSAGISKDPNTGIQDGNMIISDYYNYDNVSPVTGKTCIGIVFYVGQGEGDDAANYSPFGITRIDGYVVALKDAGNSTWGAGDIPGVENVAIAKATKFDGYAISTAAKAVGGHGVFTTISNYPTVTPPTLCSTWYLPSITQLKTVYSTHGAISSNIDPNKYPQKIVCKNIIKCGGSGLIANRYWSSTPSSSSNACYLGFHTADMSEVSKNNNYRCRAILTFQQTN